MPSQNTKVFPLGSGDEEKGMYRQGELETTGLQNGCDNGICALQFTAPLAGPGGITVILTVLTSWGGGSQGSVEPTQGLTRLHPGVCLGQGECLALRKHSSRQAKAKRAWLSC